MTPSPILYALLSAVLVSAISLFGVVTLAFSYKRLKSFVFILVALAAGTIFGDVFLHILPQVFLYDGAPVAPGILVVLGLFMFFILEKFLHWHHEHNCDGDDCELPKPVGLVNVVADGVHNFIDGIIIGVTYLASIPVGVATTIAVALHEVPQEIGDFGILVHAGYKRGRALWYNFLSATTVILGVFFATAIGTRLQEFTDTLLPFAAGGLLYIAGSDLVPELHRDRSVRRSALQLFFMIIGFAVMLLID